MGKKVKKPSHSLVKNEEYFDRGKQKVNKTLKKSEKVEQI